MALCHLPGIHRQETENKAGRQAGNPQDNADDNSCGIHNVSHFLFLYYMLQYLSGLGCLPPRDKRYAGHLTLY